MKRSEINQIIREAKEFLASRQFALPEWAEWSLQDWQTNRDKVGYINRVTYELHVDKALTEAEIEFYAI